MPDTLYFPDTALLSDRQLPLLLLFSKVNLVQLVEDDESDSSPATDTFMDARFCQALPLHPLKNDRKRFLNLINDIQHRKDDYAAQLSHITLASLSERRERGDESSHQILSSILGGGKAASEEAEGDTAERLWQARLVLKIGEILDREEEEVARALSFLEENETNVFNSLRGEADDDEEATLFGDLSRLSAPQGRPAAQIIEKRLLAWVRFVGDAELPNVPMWSTSREEVADILFDNHEQRHGAPPAHIASIMLPARADGDPLSFVEQFRALCGPTAAALLDQVVKAAASLSQDDAHTALKKEWQALLDQHYDPAASGRAAVSFYRFHDAIARSAGGMTAPRMSGPLHLAVFHLQP